jgi:hypothetical protein
MAAGAELILRVLFGISGLWVRARDLREWWRINQEDRVFFSNGPSRFQWTIWPVMVRDRTGDFVEEAEVLCFLECDQSDHAKAQRRPGKPEGVTIASASAVAPFFSTSGRMIPAW